jgi:steroid 5-alpha reductase family enzyme
MQPVLLLIFSVFVLTSVLMMVVFWWAKRINNYSIVDAAWSFSFFLVSLFLAIFSEGWIFRRVLIVLVVGFWSLRLGFFLTSRILRHYPQEDRRYLMLRERYSEALEKEFFWFFQYQAWSVVLLSIPFLVMSLNQETVFSSLEWVGAVVVVISVMGEAIADWQKSSFKKNPKNKGKNCEIGLWQFSRHPNYFFEACIWLGFFIMVMTSPGGLLCVFVPLLMWYLLLKVTGVPMSEESSIITYGQEYIDYQKRVSKFFPWFPLKKS